MADLLRGNFRQSEYGRVMLPFTLFRRLECMLELIEKLTELFGERSTEGEKVMFTLCVSEKLRDNATVMAQVQNNTGEQAMKADLPTAATTAIVEAMGSHQELATRLLSDLASKDHFVGLLYEILRRGDPAMLAALRDRR